MNIIRKIVAIALIVTLLAAASASASGFVKFTSNAYCYKKAGHDKTETVIRKGSVAEKLDTDGKYTLVRLDDKTKMWVKSETVKADKKASKSKIVYSEGGKNHSTAGKAKKVSGYKTVLSKGKCNIRTEASLSGKSLGSFKKGQRMSFRGMVSRDSRGVDWYAVTTKDGRKASVSSVYTKLEK